MYVFGLALGVAFWVSLGLVFWLPSLFPLFVFLDSPPSLKSLGVSFVEGWYLWIKFLPFVVVVTLLGVCALALPLFLILIVGWVLVLALNSLAAAFFGFWVGLFSLYWPWGVGIVSMAIPFVTYAKIKQKFPELFIDSQA
jgi:hypothetical protein